MPPAVGAAGAAGAVDTTAAGSVGTGLVPGHCSVLPVDGEEDRWVMFYHGRANEQVRHECPFPFLSLLII